MKVRGGRGALGAVSLLASLVAAACSARDVKGGPPVDDGPLGLAFASSAASSGAPRDLLVAIAATEDGLAVPARRDVDPDAAIAAAGPLQLRHGRFDSLARGAALMGTTEIALREDADLALHAGARVLAEVGARLDAKGAELATWEAALEEMSGYADDAHRRDYARRVFGRLARGGTFEGRDGEPIHLPPHDLPPHLTLDLAPGLQASSTSAGTSAEYPGADWFPTSCTGKCALGRGGVAIDTLVIHDTEGGWDASVATLQNDPGKSVQYIVGTDGRVGQLVHEADTAWHAGNHVVNQRSIGIEHVGYATTAFTEAEYAASAKLVLHLATKYGVPKDRAHVIGHDQVPDGDLIPESSPACPDSPKTCEASDDYGGASNHRDPGVWEWATYMPRIGGSAKCNDAWALWNCAHDHTRAFRCHNGTVSVVACDGPGACVTEPLGQDDVCNLQASLADAGPRSSVDAGLSPAPPSAPDASGVAAVDAGVTLQASGDVAAEGGCAVPRRGPGRSGGGAVASLVVVALGMLARRARRRWDRRHFRRLSRTLYASAIRGARG
jgi:hypothetical protein